MIELIMCHGAGSFAQHCMLHIAEAE